MKSPVTTVSCYSSPTGQPVLTSEHFPSDAEVKRTLITTAIRRADSMTAAARSLGTSPTSLRSLCRRLRVRLPSAWTRKGGR